MIQKTEYLNEDTILHNRIEWCATGDTNGPVIILFMGIHGNEKAGPKAVDRIFNWLEGNDQPLNGSVYAITGNVKALKQGIRYVDTDLNRLWERFNTSMDFSDNNGLDQPSEYNESLEIKSAVDEILTRHNDEASEFIFADLHTTSSESCAFILLNDTLANRELARDFPVPQILGIEENIHGTILSFINNLGYQAIGFEAGAHNDKDSIKRSEAFLWLLFHNCGLMELSRETLSKYENDLHAHPKVPNTYFDIQYHHLIKNPGQFEMLEGFQNFDYIEKGKSLAYENGKLVKAPKSGRIFMPLYQKMGRDGFMIIRQVSDFWLTLSSYLRKSFVHSLLKYLPGVRQLSKRAYEVDLRIARFLVSDVFHLFGYRVTKKDEQTLLCYRR